MKKRKNEKKKKNEKIKKLTNLKMKKEKNGEKI